MALIDPNTATTWKEVAAICGSNDNSLLQASVNVIGTTIPWDSNTIPANCVLKNGQMLNRADWPQLWEFAQTTPIVAESDWANNTGHYSGGDGSTTFRVPDWTGVVPAGYKPGDSNFGALGGKIGGAGHEHGLSAAAAAVGAEGGALRIGRTNLSFMSDVNAGVNFGGAQEAEGYSAQLLGNTDSASSVQPSVTVNWVIVAKSATDDDFTETIQARIVDLWNAINGNYETLSQEINGKVDPTSLNALAQQVENLLLNFASGVYNTLPDLVAAYPSGASGIYFVKQTGAGYFWNGTAFVPYTRNDASTINTQSVSTTAGQSWSKSYQNVNTLADGDGNQTLVAATPNFARKKIVVFGSSVATGWLATNASGWASMLASLLSGRGYTVINHSIPGNKTTDLISRFYSDIVPEHPDVCIIALSLANEGILGGNPEQIYSQYFCNMQRLIQMCRQQGIIPVVASCYPNTQYTATQYQYIKQFNAALDDMDVAAFNLLGAVDDGTGKWIASCRGDDWHPNDTGHAEMFASIPPTFFDCLRDFGNLPLQSQSNGILQGADTTTTSPMQIYVADTIKSFTVAFWAKDFDGAHTKVFFQCDPNSYRIRQTLGNLDCGNGGSPISSQILSNVPIRTDRLWHHIALSYNNALPQVSLYVDNILIGTVTCSLNFSGAPAALGGNPYAAAFNCENVGFKNFTLHRTCLNTGQISDLYHGKILKQSLELFCPLDDPDPAQGTHLRNLAPTTSYMVANTAALSPAPGTQDQINIAGGILYVDGGALKFRSANGTVTQIAAL